MSRHNRSAAHAPMFGNTVLNGAGVHFGYASGDHPRYDIASGHVSSVGVPNNLNTHRSWSSVCAPSAGPGVTPRRRTRRPTRRRRSRTSPRGDRRRRYRPRPRARPRPRPRLGGGGPRGRRNTAPCTSAAATGSRPATGSFARTPRTR
eukprot:31106-Pelagococcus_subviridis.AAC.3